MRNKAPLPRYGKNRTTEMAAAAPAAAGQIIHQTFIPVFRDQPSPWMKKAPGGVGLLGALSSSWSGRRDLNSRLRPWQGRTLPLSYARITRSHFRRKPNDLSMFEELLNEPKEIVQPGPGGQHNPDGKNAKTNFLNRKPESRVMQYQHRHADI